MAAIEVTFICEIAIMGPPEPADLVVRIALPEERVEAAIAEWEELLLVQIRLESPEGTQRHGFGTVRGEVEHFVADLQCLLGSGEHGKATLCDEDGQSYLRVQDEGEDRARGTFKISGRFYSVITDIDPDPEEADFFGNMWAFATGFQGIRIHRAQLARAVAELEAGLPKLTW